jgi:HD superfamily phosphohydrolase YqeK
MPDCFSKSEVTDFLNFMKLPDGTPLVPIDLMDYLWDNGFFTAPASTKYHGNYEGGLLEHSSAVAKFLAQLTEDNHLTWKNPRSPYVVGMFHDLCKIDQYRHPASDLVVDGMLLPDPSKWEYNPDTLLKGHGDKSVMLLSQFYTLTDEEIMCIRYHMGAFTDKSEWNDYTRAVRNYPNVLWTHQADMLASHVAGV